MDRQQLGQLILYIVDQVDDLGGYTTKIRLVKFLYLIDLEHQRRHGSMLTGLQWTYHLYGPYAFELPAIGNGLGFDLEREEFVNVNGRQGVLLRAPGPQDFPIWLGFGIETMANNILRVWANQDTREILQYVYHTEPMQAAQQGDGLDFSTVPLGTRYYELYIPTDRSTATQLRESLRSYAPDDASGYAHPSTTHDDILSEGLCSLDDDESSVTDFAGITPSVNGEELRATVSHED